MRKYIKQIIIGVVAALFLVIGVPIIINELYMRNSGYLTVWDGADVLAYYGTLLGSVAAVATLAGTILFTQKQIKSERLREKTKEEWKQLETIIDDLIEHINPMMVYEYIEQGVENAVNKENKMQLSKPLLEFHIKAIYLHDRIQTKGFRWHSEHKEFFDALSKAMLDMQDKVNEYRKFLYKISDTIKNYEIHLKQGFSDSEFDAIFAQLDQQKLKIFSELADLHQNMYIPLMLQKQAEFEKIYQEVDANSERILHFWDK